MTEDVAYDFDVGPSINLSARVTVTKSMRADNRGRNTSYSRVVPDPVSNSATRHRLVRHVFPDEDVPD